jgi:hypothetical protein
MKILSVLIPACFSVTTLFAQSTAEGFKSITLKKKNGAEIILSSKAQSITIDVDSQDIKSTDNPEELLIGDKVLTYTFTAGNSASKEKTSEGAQKARLLSYMKSRLDYTKHITKLHYTHAEHDWQYINNKIFLMWSYDVPNQNGLALKQINLSACCFENILNLSISSANEENTDPNKALLISAAQTLKQNDFKIDFREQYKKLRAK